MNSAHGKCKNCTERKPSFYKNALYWQFSLSSYKSVPPLDYLTKEYDFIDIKSRDNLITTVSGQTGALLYILSSPIILLALQPQLLAITLRKMKLILNKMSTTKISIF